MNMSSNDGQAQSHYPQLIHPILQKIPKGLRFLICGGASNLLFLLGLNTLTSLFQHQYTHSTIYSAFSIVYIPVGHALSCAIVFGWPNPYLPSLISTSPIGLSCAAIGTFLTGFLDRIHFDRMVKNFLELHPLMMSMKKNDDSDDEDSGTYSALVVLIVTGVFAYYASDYLMGSKSSSAKKKKE